MDLRSPENQKTPAPMGRVFCTGRGSGGRHEEVWERLSYTLDETQQYSVELLRNTVLELDPFRAVLSVFAEDEGQNVIIRYPGGDSGNAWALEFREWLAAFGVPLHFITLEPGSGRADRLLILVEATPTGFDSSV